MTDTSSVEEPVVTPVDSTTGELKETSRAPKRSLASRLFSVGPWTVLQLIALSIVVGLFLLALDFSPERQGINLGGAAWELVQTLFSAFLWIVKTFWKPLLAGAAVVLPLWLLWRLVSLPFRK